MPYKTALHPDHEALDGKLAPFGGVLLPSRYKSTKREYRSARTTCVVADWGHHALLRVSGPDRSDFLNRLLSNVVPPAGQGCHTFLLNIQGKPMVEAWLYSTADEVLLEVPRAQARTAVEQFNHYHFTENLKLHEESLTGIALVGPRSGAVLEAVSQGERPVQDYSASRLKITRLAGGGQVEVLATRTPYLGVDATVLWVPAEQAPRVWQRLLHTSLKPVAAGTEALEMLRIEAGSPRFEADYDENTLFLEMAPPDSYSETKGCYIGQEVVARVLHRGHVNRRLVGVSIEGLRKIQGKLFADGKEVGRITSGLVSPELGPIALAYIRRENWHAGTELVTEKGTPARVHELPFRKG